MNYYEHHIGDYAAATAHLSLIEDAVFTRMLRRYYLQEQPLPIDTKQVARLVGARSPDEVEAVESVLSEFFTPLDDGWHNKRADEEIARYREKQDKAKTSAIIRWANAKQPDSGRNSDAMRTHSERNANALPTQCEGNAHQTPDTSINSVPSERGEKQPEPDPIFGTGLDFLKRKGVPERQARSFLGLLRKELADDLTVSALLAEADRQDICNPIEWLRSAAKARKQQRAPPARDPPVMGKTATAFMQLQARKNENAGLVRHGNDLRSSAADAPRIGSDAAHGADHRDRGCVG